ncbi:juvenile hormone acid O-methyltransferase-like isoform X2 [Ornithodoros turicata]|uniref:juvenile hormone acid O-methyltransferase-like isoform X2 n=1 Tax=Ornithodoros turicata TaxID=34597 RepID=UPI003139581D
MALTTQVQKWHLSAGMHRRLVSHKRAVVRMPTSSRPRVPSPTSEEVKITPILRNQAFIKPELYTAGNSVQAGVNTQVLQWLNHAFEEDNGRQQYLDVGCACGSFTRRFLLERCMPCKRLVGIDISYDMIRYAREHSWHPRIVYEALDICGDVSWLIKKYGRFRRVYSFFTLHWVRDQASALRNIADLMTVGGECLLEYIGSSVVFDVWRELAKMQRWRSCAKVLEGTIPYSHYVEDQRSYIETLLHQSALKPHTCEVLRREINMPVHVLKEMYKPLLPVPTDMSREDHKDILDDFVSAMVSACGNESRDSVILRATHYLVHASKSV